MSLDEIGDDVFGTGVEMGFDLDKVIGSMLIPPAQQTPSEIAYGKRRELKPVDDSHLREEDLSGPEYWAEYDGKGLV